MQVGTKVVRIGLSTENVDMARKSSLNVYHQANFHLNH